MCRDASLNAPPSQTAIIRRFGGHTGGTETNTLESCTGGAPDPSVFANITGLANCKEGQKCNSNSKQMHRAHLHMWQTYAVYAQE